MLSGWKQNNTDMERLIHVGIVEVGITVSWQRKDDEPDGWCFVQAGCQLLFRYPRARTTDRAGVG
jgi:hypothetical protein